MPPNTPRVLTWHVHGSYLYYLAQTPCTFLLPVKEGRPEGYGGRSGHFAWPDNVIEVPADQVRDLDLDVVLYQSQRNYLLDQHDILSEVQRALPRVYLEHDPPLEHPTDQRHVIDDPGALLVHVTAFNDLMWDAGDTPTRVIDHGVLVPEGVRFLGLLDRGITVANHLHSRGRRLGPDIFDRARAEAPLDLAGMGSEARGGLGDLPHDTLLRREADYRVFFNPIRYTSLGLSVIEAMMVGLPVVGLATTELATVVEHGRSGFLDTDVRRLIPHLQRLARDPDEAARLGEAARLRAGERFNIDRFRADWLGLLEEAASRRATPASARRR
jgi:hypothetical protein